MTMKTLYCQAGDHTWERPSQRGRTPINCPEHNQEIINQARLSGLEKANAIRAQRRADEEKVLAARVEEVINDPRMQVNNIDPYKPDARSATISRLRYIQDQLTNRRDRPQNELADLEKMREKILKDPFNRLGHLL